MNLVSQNLIVKLGCVFLLTFSMSACFKNDKRGIEVGEGVNDIPGLNSNDSLGGDNTSSGQSDGSDQDQNSQAKQSVDMTIDPKFGVPEPSTQGSSGLDAAINPSFGPAVTPTAPSLTDQAVWNGIGDKTSSGITIQDI